MFKLLFNNDFYLSGGSSSDVECNEGHSYLGNDELHSQDLNALDRSVTSAEEASGRGSTDECEDDEVMKILLFLQRMRIKIRTWYP